MVVLMDLTGQTFGRLTVLERSLPNHPSGGVQWKCRCACGNVVTVIASNLKKRSTSCGCWKKESAGNIMRGKPSPQRTHGMSGTPEYNIWNGMKQRCSNENDPNYRRYGGRGISVCERWLGEQGFVNFLADMGPRPSDEHSVDREDNDGNYEPSNCYWATDTEQANNKSSNRKMTYNGETLNQAEWCRRTGIHQATMNNRLKSGWTDEEAIGTPTRRWTPPQLS